MVFAFSGKRHENNDFKSVFLLFAVLLNSKENR